MMWVITSLLVIAAWGCGPGPRPSPGGDDGGDDSTPDADPGAGSDGSSNVQTFVYAHSSSTLYKVDPDTLQISTVGGFQWPAGGPADQMTDLAIDKTGRMIGISFGGVYLVDPMTAATTLLSTLSGGDFNGLSFVPADTLGQSGDDVLIGTRNTDGAVFRIDPMTGSSSQVGDMGSAFQSSGDLVAIATFGTVQTTLGAPWDVLSHLTPVTFRATPSPHSTGFGQIWGLAFWKGTVFGFTLQGQFVTIDPTTGVATLVQSGGPEWWGAAVTTTAPVIP
jgi:hypothetical protein